MIQFQRTVFVCNSHVLLKEVFNGTLAHKITVGIFAEFSLYQVSLNDSYKNSLRTDGFPTFQCIIKQIAAMCLHTFLQLYTG